MSIRETAKTIDDMAADWAAKLDRGLSDPEQDAFDLWLSGDIRRVGALARARAIWAHAEDALARDGGSTADSLPPAASSPTRNTIFTRRRLLVGSIAAAAAALVVPALRDRPQRLSSAVGEVRRIGLGDGSTVTLGADSKISWSFGAHERLIEILTGEAFFEVVFDPARPFRLLAKGLTLRGSGSAFGVRMIAGLPLSILVSHGRLSVAGLLSSAPRMLLANMRLDVPAKADAATVSTLEPDAIERALAWRDGMLSFEGDTLADAVAQFDRYGPTRFEIADPALAREPIAGLFAANDPKGFARAIAPSLHARADIEGDLIRLSPARAQQ